MHANMPACQRLVGYDAQFFYIRHSISFLYRLSSHWSWSLTNFWRCIKIDANKTILFEWPHPTCFVWTVAALIIHLTIRCSISPQNTFTKKKSTIIYIFIKFNNNKTKNKHCSCSLLFPLFGSSLVHTYASNVPCTRFTSTAAQSLSLWLTFCSILLVFSGSKSCNSCCRTHIIDFSFGNAHVYVILHFKNQHIFLQKLQMICKCTDVHCFLPGLCILHFYELFFSTTTWNTENGILMSL